MRELPGDEFSSILRYLLPYINQIHLKGRVDCEETHRISIGIPPKGGVDREETHRISEYPSRVG